MKALNTREVLQGAARDLQRKRQSYAMEIKEIEKKAKEKMISKEQHELEKKLQKEGTASIKKTEIYEDFIKQSCGSESPKKIVSDLIRRLNLANRWMAWSQTEERTQNLINRYAMDGQRLTKELNSKLGRNKYKTILNEAGNGFLIVENQEKWEV